MESLLRVGDGRGDGLVDVVLFSFGDNFQEDLHWEPKVRVFVDLVELDDVAYGVGVTFSKTIETLRGALFSQLAWSCKLRALGEEELAVK